MRLNALLAKIQAFRAVGDEELYAVAVVDGKPVRFAVMEATRGDHQGELVLVLEARTL